MDRWYICFKTSKGVVRFLRGVWAHTYGRTDDAARATALRSYLRTATPELYIIYTPAEYTKNVAN